MQIKKGKSTWAFHWKRFKDLYSHYEDVLKFEGKNEKARMHHMVSVFENTLSCPEDEVLQPILNTARGMSHSTPLQLQNCSETNCPKYEGVLPYNCKKCGARYEDHTEDGQGIVDRANAATIWVALWPATSGGAVVGVLLGGVCPAGSARLVHTQ